MRSTTCTHESRLSSVRIVKTTFKYSTHLVTVSALIRWSGSSDTLSRQAEMAAARYVVSTWRHAPSDRSVSTFVLQYSLSVACITHIWTKGTSASICSTQRVLDGSFRAAGEIYMARITTNVSEDIIEVTISSEKSALLPDSTSSSVDSRHG